MDVIVAASGVPATGDPLYGFTQGKPKALLDVAGRPMLQWVLDALSQAQLIEHIIVVGCEEHQDEVVLKKPVTFLPTQDDILGTVRAGGKGLREINPSAKFVVLASADIPGVTPESVDWVVKTALESDHDVYYNTITREVMEARYPASNRTFTKLKNVEVGGGDLNVAKTSLLSSNQDLFDRIFKARKNPFKIASIIGYDTLFLLLTRRLTLDGAIKRVSKRLGIRGRVLVCPYPEIGMDVDKPHQLELLTQDLA